SRRAGRRRGVRCPPHVAGRRAVADLRRTAHDGTRIDSVGPASAAGPPIDPWEETMGELVSLDVRDAVGVIRLDRPPMNAINQDVVRELQEIVTELSLRDDVRAAVIHGGEKVFAAGADVEMM